MIRTKRVYDRADESDGYRIFVDRVWPEGVTKERAALGEWLKDAAPSAKLRRWWDHSAAKADEFVTRYRAELQERPATLDRIAQLEGEHGTVTLVYVTRDPVMNSAEVLRDVVEKRSGRH